MKLTLDFLKKHDACTDGIKWAVNNKLIGMPFKMIDEITGEYESYIYWLLQQANAEYMYDHNRNIAHLITPTGDETWLEYDSNHNTIYKKHISADETWEVYEDEYDLNNDNCYQTNTYEVWKEYDSNNNLIYYKNTLGHVEWLKYDSNNNKIYSKTGYGYETWYDYDQNNNIIHYKSSTGVEYWQTFDQNNNLIHYKSSTGLDITHMVEYYPDGQLKQYDNLFIPYFEK